MSKKHNMPNNLTKLQGLVNDLSHFNQESSSTWAGNVEMLSLVINDTITGIDIATQYPDFYQELLSNPALREAFLDTLEIIEREKAGTLVNLQNNTEVNLDFLSQSSDKETNKVVSQQPWKINWQRTIAQLQTIFSPSELAYRADITLSDDPYFTLLRDEFQIDNAQYAVRLECSLESDDKQVLCPFLDVAVTFQRVEHLELFPLRATLQWGSYQEKLLVTDEGRIKFSEIPIETVFDDSLEKIISALGFTLEPVL